MAKKTTETTETEQQQQQEAPQAPVLTIGGMTFTVDIVEELPEPPKGSNASLPFIHLFEQLGDRQGVFIPRSVFELNRAEGLKPLTISDMRTRLRTSFLDWRKKDEARSQMEAVLYNRKAGDVIRDGQPPVAEDGIHLYMKKP